MTALYEIIPTRKAAATQPAEMLTATVTYSDPVRAGRRVIEATGEDRATPLPRTTADFRFAAAVAEFGLVLRDSDYKGNATYASVLDRALLAAGPDEAGYRQEFVKLVRKAKTLAGGH